MQPTEAPAGWGSVDWDRVADDLHLQGHARLPGLLNADDCAALAAGYGEDLFRSRVVMARHGFGRDNMAPSNLAYSAIGTGLLLVGWLGFNAGSAGAADALAAEGVSVEVIDLRSLVPWDRPLVLQSVEKTGRAVLVSEAPRMANFMGEVAYTIQEQAFDMLSAPVIQVAGFDTPYPYVQDKIYLPGPNRIVNACVRALNY